MHRNLYICLVLVLFFSSCAAFRSRKAVVRITGSDTMLPLNQSLIEVYTKEIKDVSFICKGGGTAIGMEELVRGAADICAASRPILPDEVQALANTYHTVGMAHFICRDALEIFVHPQNPIESLQIEQVRAIFAGAVHNWQQVGGTDQPIQIYIRPPQSGTHLYLAEHVLQNVPYGEDVRLVETNLEMIQHVLEDVSAIGYGGNAFRSGVKVCKINGIAPTRENVLQDHYPLSRYLYYYTLDLPMGHVKQFIDWVISPDVQDLVEEIGYYPIWRR